MDSTELTQDSVSAAVPSWVPEVRFMAETGSTNRMAREWARSGAPHGCLVVADYQTAGRGRLGRSWIAPAGSSLLFTLILRPLILSPKGEPERFGLINLGAGIALCEALAGRGFHPRLKWPNDVSLSGKKVAGILSEAEQGAICLGVGVNVNVTEFEATVSRDATSLLIEGGEEFDRLALLADWLERFDRLVFGGQGFDGQGDDVRETYRRWCETLGVLVRVNLADRSFEGRAVDIDACGALIMDSGEVVSAGDVVHLRTTSNA